MFILHCFGAEVIMRLKKGLQGAKRGAARRVCCCWVKSDGSGLACETRSAMRSRVAGAYELSLVVLNNRLLPLISCLIFLAESRVFWMGSICQTSAQAKKTFPTRAVREKKLVLSLNIETVGSAGYVHFMRLMKQNFSLISRSFQSSLSTFLTGFSFEWSTHAIEG